MKAKFENGMSQSRRARYLTGLIRSRTVIESNQSVEGTDKG